MLNKKNQKLVDNVRKMAEAGKMREASCPSFEDPPDQ